MHNIHLVCTFHSETGKCNADELYKIIEVINPDVIFEELTRQYSLNMRQKVVMVVFQQ